MIMIVILILIYLVMGAYLALIFIDTRIEEVGAKGIIIASAIWPYLVYHGLVEAFKEDEDT